jgi:L-iditol 2-dehydrogenase
MKAAVFHGIKDIRIEDMERPRPGPREAVMRIGSAGICGTDLRIYTHGHHRIPPGTPRVLGHELAGEIVDVGAEVTTLSVGMRVGVAPNMGCGTCPQCVAGWTNLCPDYTAFGVSQDGGFAEYMLITEDAIRQGNVVRVPDGVPDHIAALAEPLSCCLNGQEALAIGPDDVVLVVGAGPIGQIHIQLAKLHGARIVIASDFSDERLAQARTNGADVLVQPARDDLLSAVRAASGGLGADAILIAAAAPAAQENALEWAAARGRVNFFGGLAKDQPYIRFNSNLVHYKQLMVTGTTGSNMRQYRAAMNLVGAGRIHLEVIARTRLPLDRIAEGFARAQSGQEMRILIEPST